MDSIHLSTQGIRLPIGVGIVPEGRGGRELANFSPGSSARISLHLDVSTTLRMGLVVAIMAVSTGCSGRGNFLNTGPSKGQLKASLSHVEVENQQLQKQIAQLRTDNHSLEDRLVREEQNNGDLTARLDNARNILRGRGIDFEDKPRTASNSKKRSMFDDDDDDDSDAASRKTLPAGQKSRKGRKPPYARIPNRTEEISDDDDDMQDAVSSRRPTWSPGSQHRTSSTTKKSRPSGEIIIDEPSMTEEQLRWTSIGDGNSSRGTTRR